jgi:hypothetical protein
VCILTVYLNLGEGREGDTIIRFTEGIDLLVGSRSLITELITGKIKNNEAFIGIFLIEILKGIILGCETTLCCSI